jgi:acyl-CoA thioesterase-1
MMRRMSGRIRPVIVLAAASMLLVACGPGMQPVRRVVFIGDSITAIWPKRGEAQVFTDHDWIDKGVIGQTSTQISSRFEHDVIAEAPDVVHILAGTNDVYPGWSLCSLPPGHATAISPPTPASSKYPADTCTNLLYMVETAQRHHIRVVLGTIPPWGPGRLSTAYDPSAGRYERISTLNAWIKRFGAELNVQVVDYHSLLAAPDGNHYVPGYTADGIHPSVQGFARMTPAAEGAIYGDQFGP